MLPAGADRAARALRRAAPGLTLAVVWLVATTAGPTSSTEVNDLYVYSVFLQLLDAGQVPYRDFGFEYPPLSLVPLWLAWETPVRFDVSLAAWMLAWWVLAQEAVRRLAGEPGAWLMAASPIVCGALVRTHFDAVPVALTLWALVWLAERRRTDGAFALLAVGGLVKLFPFVLAPIAAAWIAGRGERARAVNGLVVCAAVAVVGFGPFVLLGGVDGMVRFHLDRPVQLESTPASIAFALGSPTVTGTEANPDPYKSNGVAGAGVDALQTLFAVLSVAAIAAVLLAAARRPSSDDLLRCAFAAVLAFVALGKVLSPQYVMWLFPLAAIVLVRGDRLAGGLTIAACALTQAWFPSRYFDVVAEDPALLAVVALRNALLLMALGATAAALARSPRLAAAAPRSG